ncbi:glutathione peroxidase [Heliophilum fasciatum]|uniref:Glutathione peroxidase n=1 Tax=Heliophilum fasciatum TaxID=35700 RepID=A0A4R2RPU8_9FIRM|nr:glutathione peroxidase [Heliophilum fasciatum]MCW2277545.1 glutathione peroxidase [Heliophilum fasciatum]TCP65164.1 glutathione peroxidase [Heliophilum fasciatum]
MSVYDFTAKTIAGKEKPLADYRGKVLIIVNTASHCGFTSQYKGLQKLYEQYNEAGFEILGFPCNQFMNQEPGTNDEIESFCQINFGVTFQLFDKIDVNGPDAHPLYKYLVKEAPGFLQTEAIKWNFTKFMVDRQGRVVKRFAPTVTPEEMEAEIKALL